MLGFRERLAPLLSNVLRCEALANGADSLIAAAAAAGNFNEAAGV